MGVEKMMNPSCFKVLPLVYEESLSYYESVCKLYHKINEIVNEIDSLTIDVLNQSKGYTDKAISGLEGRVTNAVDEINRLKSELDKQYTEFYNLTNAQLQIFNQRLSGYDKEIADAVIGINARTDEAIKQNNDYVLEEIGKGVVNVRVTNYFTGERVTIQEMFDYLANLHVENGITFDSLTNKKISYTNLANLNLDYTTLIISGETAIV